MRTSTAPSYVNPRACAPRGRPARSATARSAVRLVRRNDRRLGERTSSAPAARRDRGEGTGRGARRLEEEGYFLHLRRVPGSLNVQSPATNALLPHLPAGPAVSS